MRVGCCVSNAAQLDAAERAGADYVEVPVASWVMGAGGPEPAAAAPAEAEAANVFLPSDLALVGPTADAGRIDAYVRDAIERLAGLGVRTLVFGSGGARAIPDGVSRDRGLEDLER